MKFKITAEFKTIEGATVKMEASEVYAFGLETAIAEILRAHRRASRAEFVHDHPLSQGSASTGVFDPTHP